MLAIIAVAIVISGCRSTFLSSPYSSLSGTTIDAITKKPVLEAVVSIGARIVKTADGTFYIDRLIPGDFGIHVEADGYRPYNGVVKIEDAQTTASIELEPIDPTVQNPEDNSDESNSGVSDSTPMPPSETEDGQGNGSGSGVVNPSGNETQTSKPAIADPIPGCEPFTEIETAMADRLIEELKQKNIAVPGWVEGRSETILFARLVNAEAGGESYDGKVAVAATVLARLNSPFYPKTIAGVILQVVDGIYYQYSPVLDGRINIVATQEAFNAVRDALAGIDPSNGGNGFYNPDKTTNSWVRSQPVTAVIGGHVFFRYSQSGSLYLPKVDILR